MYQYTLPNGIIIDPELLFDRVTDSAVWPQVYLDVETGVIVNIPNQQSLGKWLEANHNTQARHFLLEPFTIADQTQFARAFVDSILQNELSKMKLGVVMSLIACGDIDGFEDFLFEKTDGFIHAWDQYLADEAYDYVDRWLTENPLCKIERKFVGCGDCEICKVMANANGSDISALVQAFDTEHVMASVTKQLQNKSETQKVSSDAGRHVHNVLTFKVSLNNSRPLIWRRIIVPDNFTFFDLHCAIQNAMGWSDSHLHQFTVSSHKKGESVRDSTKVICLPNPDWDDGGTLFETFNEKNEYLVDWFGPKIQQCVYEYDFGDSWLHTVLFEGSVAPEPDKLYPICTGGKMACPPDDCGGLSGYERIKKILKNKKHPEYKDVCDWLLIEKEEEFDPSAFNPNTVEFDNPADVWKDDQDFR